MAESSYLWTTSGTGDGAVPYTRTDWSVISRILAWSNGIVPGFLNGLSQSIVSANTFRVNTGGAVVDGKPYYNSTSQDINIPSTIGAGNSRIDRIVLRADWSTQTVRIFRIAGTDPGANPTVPAYTQTSGSIWDLPLYQVRVNDVGTLSNVVDERSYIQIPSLGITDGAITTSKLAAGSVDNTKLRDSAGLSVIGRGVSSSGDPSDLVASVDGQVLRRSGTTLGFGQVGTGGIAAGAIIGSLLNDGAVSTAKLGTDAVDDTKVGNRVPKLPYRQGGNSTDWSVDGLTNYQVGPVQMLVGIEERTASAGGSSTTSISILFPGAAPFSAAPILIPVMISGPSYAQIWSTTPPTTGGATVTIQRTVTTNNDTYVIAWIAIGPTT